MLCTENSSMQFVRSALPIAVNCYEAGRAVQNFAWPDKLSQLKKDSLEAHLIQVSANTQRVRQVYDNRLVARASNKQTIHATHLRPMNEKQMAVS